MIFVTPKSPYVIHVTVAFLALVQVTAVSSPVAAQSLPQLPLTFLDTTYAPPSTGQLITVNTGGDLQAALNQANSGDIIELEAGATFVGNFTLPTKPGAEWIYIRSSATASLPPPGTRVSPAQTSLMPKIVSPNTLPALSADFGAHHYRFVGIEITTTWSSREGTLSNLILFGYDVDGNSAASLADLPHDITFDRCYIHGTPTGHVLRGLAANSASTAVVDSYVADFHAEGNDSQAIAVWNGAGPFKIVNNYLEAAAENLLFGGASPSITNLVPSDIEVRHNYFSKPLSWKLDDPSYAGIPWVVKNLAELKNAQRVLLDGNVFEHVWPAAQIGFAILFTVRNDDVIAPWSVVQDVTFTHNILRHVGGGVGILGLDSNAPSQQTKRILIRDNVFDAVTTPPTDDARVFQILNAAADVTIDHNTVFQAGPIIVVDDAPSTGFTYTNNIASEYQGVVGSGTGVGLPTLEFWFPGYVYARNVQPGGNPLVYPPDNFFPASLGDVGFVDLVGGDYHLATTSPYRNGGTDGKDIGADIDALMAATAGALEGASPPPPTLHSLSPASIVAGAADFGLTVNGSNFVSTSVVRWNGSNRATTFVSSTQLLSTILASDAALAGMAQVNVVNPAPGGGTSNTLPLTIESTFPLTIIRAGSGAGAVTSTPSGISCGASCSANFLSGTAVVLTANPDATSVFTGWSGGGCSGTDPCTVTVIAATTAPATSAPQGFALTVTRSGTGTGTVTSTPAGIDCGATCSASYPSDTPVTLTATPAVGSVFTGWSGGGCTGSDPCVVTVTAATTVTATFALQNFTLTVAPSGTGVGTVTSAPAGIDCGATCTASYSYNTTVTLTATPALGSAFTGWSGGGCTGTGPCTVTLTAATAVTASFTPTFVLTVSKPGAGAGTVSSTPAGIDCGPTCTASFVSGTVVTLTAAPAAGSVFTGWSGGACSGTGPCTLTLTATTAVTATFTPSFVLTVTTAGAAAGTVISTPAGIDCGTACSASYTSGTVVTLTATPAVASVFTGWSGDACTGTDSCVVTVTAATTVTATFAVQSFAVTLIPSGTGVGTVTSAPAGIDCGPTCAASYSYNTTVTLTATPAMGSAFTGWSGGGCTGTGPCT